MKTNKTIYDERVLIYDEKIHEYRMTKLDSYKRYLHTIKPIEDLLNYLDK